MRAACIQNGCILPEVYQLVDNVCRVKMTAGACGGTAESNKDLGYKGLSFSIANIGLRSQTAASYAITFPGNSKLVQLSTAMFVSASRSDGKISVQFQSDDTGSAALSKINLVGKPTLLKTKGWTTRRTAEPTNSNCQSSRRDRE